jgi:exopolyphosphatase/guanosine-5'-triphosphate,3'-diphosphate pyrophosphatase
VVDIGGGSTEFVLGVDDGDGWELDGCVSVNLGCVRMTERHLHGDPPTPVEVASVRAEVGRALEVVREQVSVDRAASLVGLAGTVTTMAAMALDLDAYDAARQHGSTMTLQQVQAIATALIGMTRVERALACPSCTLAGGRDRRRALILEGIMSGFGIERVIVSECDLLDGIVYSAT